MQHYAKGVLRGKRMIDGIEIETGSGNVFADLGLPDADKLQIQV